jgi:pimeloyl-[acyl-carrier protein] methyl ester esterase
MRLVLLHALPLDGRMWQSQMHLAPGATFAPDLYGLGNSVQDWAAAVLEQAGDEELVVVGCSVGGSCALEVAAQAPSRVAAVVLVEAKAAHRPDPAFRDEAVRVLLSEGMSGAWPRYWFPLFAPSSSPQVVGRARELAFAQDVGDVIRGVKAFHGRRDLAEFVRTWTKPLVVVSGDLGRPAPPSRGAMLAASAPSGEFHLVPRCGHYVNLEQPQAFDELLGRLIERWWEG